LSFRNFSICVKDYSNGSDGIDSSTPRPKPTFRKKDLFITKL